MLVALLDCKTCPCAFSLILPLTVYPFRPCATPPFLCFVFVAFIVANACGLCVSQSVVEQAGWAYYHCTSSILKATCNRHECEGSAAAYALALYRPSVHGEREGLPIDICCSLSLFPISGEDLEKLGYFHSAYSIPIFLDHCFSFFFLRSFLPTYSLVKSVFSDLWWCSVCKR